MNPKNHCAQKTFPHRSLGHRCIYTEKPLQNTLYRKACTKQFLVLLCTTKLAPSAPQHYFVQQSLRKVGKFLVLLCTSKLAQSRKVPSTTLYFKACTKLAVLLCTSLCYKACTKYFPVLLCTTKLAQSMSQYYFVLQSLHKVLASTTLYYKAGTKQFPVLLCTTKLAQRSLCAFCREVVPTKPFTKTALYYKMTLESEPTPLATKWVGGFNGGSKANVGHYKMTLRTHFVVKTGCSEKS